MEYHHRVAKARALELLDMMPDAESECPKYCQPRPKPFNKPIRPAPKKDDEPPETTRQYLNRTVTVAVAKAMNELTQVRPAEPLKFLAECLLKINSEQLAAAPFIDDDDLD